MSRLGCLYVSEEAKHKLFKIPGYCDVGSVNMPAMFGLAAILDKDSPLDLVSGGKVPSHLILYHLNFILILIPSGSSHS